MTPNRIITLALKQAGALGIGQTPNPEDVADAFDILNLMLGQWANKRLMVFREADIACVATGALSYGVGPGSDFDTLRPDKLAGVYVRLNYQAARRGNEFILDQSLLDGPDLLDGTIAATPSVPVTGSIDYSLDLLDAREDYAMLPRKGWSGVPGVAFYDPSFPVGTLYVNPEPTAAYEIHILVKQQLVQFATTDEEIALPQQYLDAMLYNLAVRLAPMFQLEMRADVVQLARNALVTIRQSNTTVPRLSMPAGLPGLDRGSYAGPGGFGGIANAAAFGGIGTGGGIGLPPAPPPPIVIPDITSTLGQSTLGQMILGA